MEERLMILKMLQEGKITVEEANKLIEAIEKGNQRPEHSRINAAKFEEKMGKISEKMGKLGEKAEKLGAQIGENININAKEFGSNSERFAEEFSKKMESFGNDMAEAAVKFSDKLVNFLSNTFDIGYDKYQFTKNYTYQVGEKANIRVKASNFAVKFNPSDTDEILLNLYVNSNIPQLNIDEFFKSEVEGSNYSFATEFTGRTWGKIELLVPRNLGSVTINTTNGKCELSELSADLINAHTSNGKIVLCNCNVNDLEAITNNGKIVCESTTARVTNLSTSNGKIDLIDSKLDIVDAVTSNGSILLSGIKKLEAAEGKYNLRTSNGKIYIGLNNCENCGFMVDANTSLGGINIELPDLTYMVNKRTSTLNSSAVVKSSNFDNVENKIYIKANTSNASITIEGEK
ncbi:MAG: DUF4097 family beta strand repeat-containing protein [Bacillota bacterium]